MITWEYKHGAPASPDVTLYDVVHDGSFEVGSASTTQFTVKSGTEWVVFHGSFTTNIVGLPVTGTITGFDVYSGLSPLLAASGYEIDLANLLAVSQVNDQFYGLVTDVERTINGSAEDDTLIGQTQNDRIDGKDGKDTLIGGDGNDLMSGGNGKDSLFGGLDVDTADYSEKTGALNISLNVNYASIVTVDGTTEDIIRDFENVVGGGGNDKISGSVLSNLLAGNAGADILAGGGGRDLILGGKGHDIARGGADNDVISGGRGADILFGGAGNDQFRFDVKLAASQADVIKGFSHGHDVIALHHAVFTGLANGRLDGAHFQTGAAALDGDDRIIYDQGTGAVYYDKDGTGGAAQVKFAVLDHHPTVTAHDFLVY